MPRTFEDVLERKAKADRKKFKIEKTIPGAESTVTVTGGMLGNAVGKGFGGVRGKVIGKSVGLIYGKKMGKEVKIKDSVYQEAYDKSFKKEAERLSNEEIGSISALSGMAPMIGFQAYHSLKDNEMMKNMDVFGGTSNNKQINKLNRIMGYNSPVFLNSPTSIAGGGGAFNPFDDSVHVYAKNKKNLSGKELATLAHELGHYKNSKSLGKSLTKLYALSRSIGGPLSLFGAAGAGFAEDDKDAKMMAIAGSTIPSVTLAEESAATARGLKGLSKYHGGGIKGLKLALLKDRLGGLRMAGANIFSYGSLAAIPLITYAVRKKLKDRENNIGGTKGKVIGKSTGLIIGKKSGKEAHFNQPLEKVSFQRSSEPSSASRAWKAAASGVSIAGSGALLYSALRKKPGLIKKTFGKYLKPRQIVWGKSKKDSSILERISGKDYDPIYRHAKGGARLKKDEIGLFHGFDYDKKKLKSKHISAPGQKSLLDAQDKLVYGKKLHKAGIGAKTWGLTSDDVAKLKKMKKDEDAIKYLDKKHGKGKWIYKPRDDSGEVVPATIGKNSIISSDSLKKTKHKSRIDEGHGLPNMQYKMVKHIRKNPEKFIGQQKLDIQGEYRVRTINGKVVGVINRYPDKRLAKVMTRAGILGKNEKQSIGVIPMSTRFGKGKEISDFVGKNRKAFDLGDRGKRINTIAFDVAVIGKGKNRKFKVIEANTTSGADLDNPYIAGKVYKELTGKAGVIEKSVKGTGAAGLAGASVIPHLKKDKKHGKEIIS